MGASCLFTTNIFPPPEDDIRRGSVATPIASSSRGWYSLQIKLLCRSCSRPICDRISSMGSDSFSLKPTLVYQGKPSVVFTRTDEKVLLESMKPVLVGKFTHDRPPIGLIKEFFVSLKLRGYEMRVFKWDSDFNPFKESPIVPVWIRNEAQDEQKSKDCKEGPAHTVARPSWNDIVEKEAALEKSCAQGSAEIVEDVTRTNGTTIQVPQVSDGPGIDRATLLKLHG
ncbi:hypothetical protein Leryth_022384 [Lithospermum erythrorhizon]|nr:hypothetical protein Leryth_022384 [Lithospermum erythrorhizon]